MKRILLTLGVIAMVAAFAFIQGCSNDDNPIQALAESQVGGEQLSIESDIDNKDLSFEMSVYDTSTIAWDYNLIKDLIPSLPVNASGWAVINARIFNRALQDNCRNVYKECKPWASEDVVNDATGYTLPSTHWNDYYLNSGAHVTRIVDGNVWGGGTIERGLSYGNIIQMKIQTSGYMGPHTAIFVCYTSSGMWWIDSNWYTRSHPNWVFIHHVPFSWFRSYVGSKYSVYQAWD